MITFSQTNLIMVLVSQLQQSTLLAHDHTICKCTHLFSFPSLKCTSRNPPKLQLFCLLPNVLPCSRNTPVLSNRADLGILRWILLVWSPSLLTKLFKSNSTDLRSSGLPQAQKAIAVSNSYPTLSLTLRHCANILGEELWSHSRHWIVTMRFSVTFLHYFPLL